MLWYLMCLKLFLFQDTDNTRSRRTFIYNIKNNSWSEGPSLLEPRADHSSCAIQSDDGSTQCIIVIGGLTNQGRYLKSVEILNVKNIKSHWSIGAKWPINNQQWVKGPPLPCIVEHAKCVPLHPLTNFACNIIGGQNVENEPINRYSSDVYGLNKELTEWKLLGKIRTGRNNHIALPLST